MPKIPMASDAGLGTKTFNSVVSTPTYQKPVAKELGPKLEVNAINVKEAPVADLASIKPVAPSMAPGQYMQQGFEAAQRTMDSIATQNAQEIQTTNKIKETTGLLVQLGDQKQAYTKSTMDVLNNPDMSNEDKQKELTKQEEDFRAIIPATKPYLQEIAAREVINTIGSVKTEAQKVYLANTQDGIKADIEKRNSQLVLEAASTGNLNGSLEHFDALAGAYKGAGLPQAQFVKDRQALEQTILQNDIMATLKSTDTKSGRDALDAVGVLYNRLTEVGDNGVPKNWTNLHPQQRFSDISEVINKKNAIEAAMQVQGNKELGNLKSAFNVNRDFYGEALKNGDPVDPSFAAAVKKQAATLMQMDPDKSAGYMGMMQIQKLEREYGPAYQLQQAAADPLRGTGAQPISYADMASPQALQQKIATNIQIGQMVKTKKSLSFVPILREADMEGVAKTVEENPGSGIRMIYTIKNDLKQDGNKSLMYMAGQMANSKDPAAPAVAAIIYNVAKGDYNTAQAVGNGMEVIKNKTITMPKDTDLRNMFDKMMGDAMSENSATRGLNFEVYKTVYAGMAARKNIVDGSFDRDTAGAAFNRVVGNVIRWNGSNVVVPDGTQPQQFMNYLNGITPETVHAWGGMYGMTDEQAADFIKNDGSLKVSSPAGQYTVEYEGKQASTKRLLNKPFIIDVNTPIINPKIISDVPPITTRLTQINEDATMFGH